MRELLQGFEIQVAGFSGLDENQNWHPRDLNLRVQKDSFIPVSKWAKDWLSEARIELHQKRAFLGSIPPSCTLNASFSYTDLWLNSPLPWLGTATERKTRNYHSASATLLFSIQGLTVHFSPQQLSSQLAQLFILDRIPAQRVNTSAFL